MLLAAATEAFATTLRPSAREPGRVFAADFGSRKMSKELAVLDMAERSLVPTWENCVRAALSAKVAVEDEVAKSRSAQVRSVPLMSLVLQRGSLMVVGRPTM